MFKEVPQGRRKMMQVRNSDLHKEEYERRNISRRDTFLDFLKFFVRKLTVCFSLPQSGCPGEAGLGKGELKGRPSHQGWEGAIGMPFVGPAPQVLTLQCAGT